jgi:putative ABC transport system ATP-binding protein
MPASEALTGQPDQAVDAASRAVQITKTYGSGPSEVTALDHVSVAFGRGRFTAVMGPSGSGKSTLLHCMAGLDSVDQGTVYLGDTDLTRLGERQLTRLRRERIGFVFQSFNLLPTLTAAENIALPSRLAGRTVDQSWVDRLTDAVGLGDRLGHRPAELSGGQQQRVAAARARRGGRRSFSRTSRPATSTPVPARSCWRSCVARWTSSGRPS